MRMDNYTKKEMNQDFKDIKIISKRSELEWCSHHNIN